MQWKCSQPAMLNWQIIDSSMHMSTNENIDPYCKDFFHFVQVCKLNLVRGS